MSRGYCAARSAKLYSHRGKREHSKVLNGLTVLVLIVVVIVITIVMAIHVGAIAPRLLELLVPFACLLAAFAVPLDSVSQPIFSLVDTLFTL